MDLTEPLCVCEASVAQGGMSVVIDCHSTTDGTEALIVLLMDPPMRKLHHARKCL